MYTFRELQRACRGTKDKSGTKLAVLGNCATQFFSEAIRGYGLLSDHPVDVFDADFDQIDAMIIDADSEVYGFDPDNILLFLSSEKLYEEFLGLDIRDREGFADTYIKHVTYLWNLIDKHHPCGIIHANAVDIDDAVLGQYSNKVPSTFSYQLARINYLLNYEASKRDNVYILDLRRMQTEIGRSVFHDKKLYYSARMPISTSVLPLVAERVVDILMAKAGLSKKCVILDLDNTLWGGIIGDDGLSGIEIGELGIGRVYTDIQHWLKQLKEYGILLAVCSKNDEDIAKEPFIKLEEMVLKLDDFALFVANWDDKASNIELIQKTLNIGMDSIVFIDDSPFERDLVKQKHPSITVPDLPEDPTSWLDLLKSNNYFETASYSSETNNRTDLYRAEFERQKTEYNYESIDDYLVSLKMTGSVRRFDPDRYSRIAELTQRSNQFNLRTVRYSESEIRHIAEDSNYIPLYFTLQDRYGDYGLISVVILKKITEEKLFIDTWLMSCRVLKKSMEEFIMNSLIEIASKEGYSEIAAEYIPTPKNGQVKDIYSRFGFEKTGEGQYNIKVSEYNTFKSFVGKVL